jgi:hypothetical protein
MNFMRLFAATLAMMVCTAFSPGQLHRRPRALTQLSRSTRLSASTSSLVVISPPGGIGEVSAVKAAEMGSAVRWFVVSSGSSREVILSQEVLASIAAAGGSVELAGADVPSLLLPPEDPNSAVTAVSAWCGAAEAIVCTFDGCETSPAEKKKLKLDDEDPEFAWKNAIKIAAQQASSKISGTKLAILSANGDMDDDLQSVSSGIGGFVGSLLKGKRMEIPSSLTQAMSGMSAGFTSAAAKIATLRHGELFGTPESSPNFSALVGGPRRDPELCEEFQFRDIRVDPTLSLMGNFMMGKTTRSSRHVIGQAAALLVLGKVTVVPGLDICVSSQRGTDVVTMEQWEKEFSRVAEDLMTADSTGGGAQLFSVDFASVPDVERLADWLATKWAPAVLRTYDIAAIRVGARPVYTTRTSPGTLQIDWQQLVDFESVTVGKMEIVVTDKGLKALRLAGDASKGFGSVSRIPLNGEDVLVRRLAEASSQAIEKGLAKKVSGKGWGTILQIHKAVSQMPHIISLPQAKAVKKAVEEYKKPEPVVAAAPVTSIQSSGTVEASIAAASSGPRQAGARRSTERARGKRRKTSTESSNGGSPTPTEE